MFNYFPRIVAVVGDADVWCFDCARERFGDDVIDGNAIDNEGNETSPIFDHENLTDLCCGGCLQLIEDTF